MSIVRLLALRLKRKGQIKQKIAVVRDSSSLGNDLLLGIEAIDFNDSCFSGVLSGRVVRLTAAPQCKCQTRFYRCREEFGLNWLCGFRVIVVDLIDKNLPVRVE